MNRGQTPSRQIPSRYMQASKLAGKNSTIRENKCEEPAKPAPKRSSPLKKGKETKKEPEPKKRMIEVGSKTNKRLSEKESKLQEIRKKNDAINYEKAIDDTKKLSLWIQKEYAQPKRDNEAKENQKTNNKLEKKNDKLLQEINDVKLQTYILREKQNLLKDRKALLESLKSVVPLAKTISRSVDSYDSLSSSVFMENLTESQLCHMQSDLPELSKNFDKFLHSMS